MSTSERTDLLIGERPAARLSVLDGGVDEARKDDGACALNVVVEHAVVVAVPVKVEESGLGREVLKLDECRGKDLAEGYHELVEEGDVVGQRPTLLPEAEVERVVEKLLVVGSHVENDRQCLSRVDSACGSIQGELADRDTDTAETEVTEAKDARAVGDDSDLDVLLAPVLEDSLDVACVVDRDEEALGLGVELAEALAELADDGRVDQGRDLEQVGVDERVEEPGVCPAKLSEVEVLLDARLLGPELVQGADLLLGERLVRTGEGGRSGRQKVSRLAARRRVDEGLGSGVERRTQGRGH